uniref:exodeoxyribonuclease III n=1 Tax=Kryptolebias marmoratus TaxID=37003 RepID=A0A3Q2ZLT7_KRYMA
MGEYCYNTLSQISLNVKGINNVIKRQKILTFLKKENTKIALLSETHLTDNEHLKLRRNWVGQVHYSSHNSKSRGVAILIHRSLPFTLEKTMSDNDGRYVLISGFLYGEHILIGCIYGPNIYEATFFPKLLSDIASVHTPYIVVGGDFNCIHDPNVDQAPPRSTSTSRKSLRLREFCQDLELYDTWRVTNPRERDYTFFSQPHQTFSRIDFFLSSRMILDRVRNCSISTCTISDHSPVILCISPPYADPASRHWRMNPSLLSYPSFTNYITDQWNFFMDTNKTPDVNPSLLWETAKAFIRGCVISYTTAQKKAAIKDQLHLERIVQETELQFKNTPSRALSKKLEAARSALNQLLTKQAEATIFFAKHRLYQSGNKPGRLLARLTKGRMESPPGLPHSHTRQANKRQTKPNSDKWTLNNTVAAQKTQTRSQNLPNHKWQKTQTVTHANLQSVPHIFIFVLKNC